MNVATVGTLNIRYWDVDVQPERQWDVRLPLICDVIRQSGAWIVGLQESRQLPFGVSQARQVAQMLGNEWRVAEGGRDTATIWRSDRFTFAGPSQSVPLNVDYPAPFPNRQPRSALFTRFFDRWTGKAILFYNLHAPVNPDDVPAGATFVGVSGEAGRRVAERANADLARFDNASAVIVGDTNSAGTFWANVVSRGFLDCADQGVPFRHAPLRSGNQWDPMMFDKQDSVWIDRIFTSADVETERVGLVLQYESGTSLPVKAPLYSDHFMVAATVRFS